MTEHTPGPWSIAESRSPDNYCQIINHDTGYHIGAVYGVSGDRVNEGNARLIAAAPDLFEVVQTLLICCDQDFIANTSHQDSLGVLADAARAAIAKATEAGNV